MPPAPLVPEIAILPAMMVGALNLSVWAGKAMRKRLYPPPCAIYYTGVYIGACEAIMPNDPEDKKRVLARVRRIRGQCEALERALDSGADCGPVLQQIAAVRGAINGLMAEVLESYIREEFADSRDGAEPRGRELLSLVRSYLK